MADQPFLGPTFKYRSILESYFQDVSNSFDFAEDQVKVEKMGRVLSDFLESKVEYPEKNLNTLTAISYIIWQREEDINKDNWDFDGEFEKVLMDVYRKLNLNFVKGLNTIEQSKPFIKQIDGNPISKKYSPVGLLVEFSAKGDYSSFPALLSSSIRQIITDLMSSEGANVVSPMDEPNYKELLTSLISLYYLFNSDLRN